MEVVGIHHYRPLKPLKHTQIISNMLHLRVVTCILTTLLTHLLWEQVPKNYFFGRSDTVPWLQRCDQSDRTAVNVSVTTWSQHVDGAFWRFSDVFRGFRGGDDVSPLLPRNMKNCQREAAVWRQTERTEKGKASVFLSYIGIVDDRLNPPKSAVFL